MGEVVVIGSLNVDVTVTVERFPAPGETLTGSEPVRTPGGKSANQAVAAATLGARVRLVGAVGDDEDAALATSLARGAGVDVTGVRRLDGHATGTATIVVDAAGENTIIVSPGANAAVPVDACTGIGAGDVLCLALEIPVPVVTVAARTAHDAGATVLLNLSPYIEVPDELLACTDVLLLNAAEAQQLLGPEQGWPGALHERGVGRAVVTLGADGAVVLDTTVTRLAPTPVDVVDTTGCGDAFTGALAARLAAGDELADGARIAGRVAALAATAPGAQSSYATFAGR